MALETTTNRVSYSGNGVTTVFSFPYYFLAQGDLTVILTSALGVETTQTITTHYTVSGAGVAAGGSVTMLTAPASGTTLTIINDPDLTQSVDLRENDSLPAETVEQAFDRLTMIAQRSRNLVERSVRLTDGFTDAFTLTLPSDLATANKALVTNSTGDGFDMGPTISEISNAQTYATNAASSASAAAASASAASTSETNAAASATAAQAAVDSVIWRDVEFVDFSDTPITVVDGDRGKLFAVDTSSGNVVINLPSIAALDLASPWSLGIKKTTSDANTVTINRNGTDTIDGATSTSLDTGGSGVVLIPDTDPSPDDWTTQAFGQIGDGSVTSAKLNDAFISGLTTVTADPADYVAIADSSDSGNKKKAIITDLQTLEYRSVTSTDTATAADSFLNLSGSSFTQTLPTAVGIAGKTFTIMHSGTSITNKYTIATTSSQTIGSYGSGGIVLWINGDRLKVMSDGANWLILDYAATTPLFVGTQSSEAVTAATNITFTSQIDNHGAWSTTFYTTPFPGNYFVNLSMAAAIVSNYNVYVAGSLNKAITANAGSSYPEAGSTILYNLAANVTISFRVQNTTTVTNGRVMIYKLPTMGLP